MATPLRAQFFLPALALLSLGAQSQPAVRGSMPPAGATPAHHGIQPDKKPLRKSYVDILFSLLDRRRDPFRNDFRRIDIHARQVGISLDFRSEHRRSHGARRDVGDGDFRVGKLPSQRFAEGAKARLRA